MIQTGWLQDDFNIWMHVSCSAATRSGHSYFSDYADQEKKNWFEILLMRNLRWGFPFAFDATTKK